MWDRPSCAPSGTEAPRDERSETSSYRGPKYRGPDYPPGISFRCSRAQVVAIEPDRFSPTTPDTGAARRYVTWDNGSRMYDNDGYSLPNKLHQYLGVTPAHLRNLGFEAPFHLIERRCSETVRKLRFGRLDESLSGRTD